MTEPITTQKSLIVPNTGDLSGAWGTSALNPNFQTIDALFGGVTTISLSGATTLALSVPATTGIWPGGSVSQSVNSLIRFTGAQTGSATIQFALPGYYIIENNCTGTTSVRLQPSNLTGNCIGAIPGKKCHVFFDGTHMDYLNQSDPGTAYDLHTFTVAYPPWMLACTVLPYLYKDGNVYNVATYPALGALLSGAFGGNGVTTFGVPDERARFRLGVDSGATGRVTSIGSGINPAVLGAAGGNQFLTSHTHAGTTAGQSADHSHAGVPAPTSITSGGYSGSSTNVYAASSTFNSSTGGASNDHTHTFTSSSTGAGSSQNMPPSIVSIMPFIKT